MTAFQVIEQRLIDAAYAYLSLVALTVLIVACVLVHAGLRHMYRRLARTRRPVYVAPVDLCERLYEMPAYQGPDLTEGRMRLEQAIRDHEDGEQ